MYMSLMDCNTDRNNNDDISIDLPIAIIKCPLCHGSGTILCNMKNAKIACFFSHHRSQSRNAVVATVRVG